MLLISFFAFAATSDDDFSIGNSVFRPLNVRGIDTSYVITRERETLLDTYFSAVALDQFPTPLEDSLCFNSWLEIGSFADFSRVQVLGEFGIDRLTDSTSVFRISTLSDIEAFSAAGVSYDGQPDLRAADQLRLDSLSTDSILLLFEEHRIVPMRLRFNTQDSISAWPCR